MAGSSMPLACDLSLGIWVPNNTVQDFVAQVSGIPDVSHRILKLDDHLNRLQNEMNKIDAFKKDLPLCMLLLNNAIATIKEEVRKCEKSNVDPVLEEFIPLKNDEKDDNLDDNKENDGTKMNWLRSVQLWSSDNLNPCQNPDKLSPVAVDADEKRKEEALNRDDLFSIGKNRKSGIEFGTSNFTKEGRDESPALTLWTPEIKNSKGEIYSSSKSSSSRSVSSSATNDHSNTKPSHHQTIRKQRRCWSPELHRRFVNALQHLGGAQAATPKQIRELMQVDGLTNDEVKSHLQKYRIHTRRVLPPATTSTIPPGVLGDLWKHGESSKSMPSNSQSRSPHGPLHITGFSRGTSTTGVGKQDERSDSRS